MSEVVKKKGLVPKLRFPEFCGLPFEMQEGGRHFLPINDRDHKSDLPILAITQEHGAIPRELIDYNVAVTEESIASYKIVRDGDFIISLRSFQGGIECSRYTGLCSPAYIVLRASKELNRDFISQYFKTKSYIAQLNHELEGLRDGKMISYAQFSRILLPIPHRAEQRKIAECLQSLDELIAAETEKLETLKRHKKGLLQQLFPAEDETTPRLRFPKFRDASEWNAQTLDEISPAIFDGTHQTPTYVDEGVPFYSVENLITGRANKFISREDYELATKRNKPQKNDVLVTRIGNIGHAVHVDWDFDFSIYVTLAVIKQSPRFSSRFLSFYIQSDTYQKELSGVSLMSAIPCKVNMEDLRQTVVMLPSIEEQTLVANCIDTVDRAINGSTLIVSLLRSHKAALMQQLFPSLEDMETTTA